MHTGHSNGGRNGNKEHPRRKAHKLTAAVKPVQKVILIYGCSHLGERTTGEASPPGECTQNDHSAQKYSTPAMWTSWPCP